jgi:hypothetical protein
MRSLIHSLALSPLTDSSLTLCLCVRGWAAGSARMCCVPRARPRWSSGWPRSTTRSLCLSSQPLLLPAAPTRPPVPLLLLLLLLLLLGMAGGHRHPCLPKWTQQVYRRRPLRWLPMERVGERGRGRHRRWKSAGRCAVSRRLLALVSRPWTMTTTRPEDMCAGPCVYSSAPARVCMLHTLRGEGGSEGKRDAMRAGSWRCP